MSDDRWFKLLIQAVGVLLIGMAAPMCFWYVGGVIEKFAHAPNHEAMSYMWVRLPGVLGYGSQAAFGVYLVRGGGRLVPWCLRRTREPTK